MYSTLNETAKITSETIISIENYLFRDYKGKKSPSESESDDEEAPDAEADVNVDRVDVDSDPSTEMDESDMCGRKRWLKRTLIAMDPNLDVVIIAAIQKFVVLGRSKKNVDGVRVMELVAKMQATRDHHTYISAIAVFGVRPPSSTSSQSLPTDWTCICIGLNTGQIMFYTERGVLIFYERFANCKIESVRLGPSTLPGNQELVALTADAKVIVVEGLSLYTTLRTARAQIARGERSLEEICGHLQLNASQLQLDRLQNVGDLQVVGFARPDTFDQYMSAFYTAGREEVITPKQLPIYANFMCAPTMRTKEKKSQSDEFICFLWHNTQPSTGTLTDAIFTLTSQITSNIPSFGFRTLTGLGISRKDRMPKKEVFESRTNWVPLKSLLRDNKRTVERTFLPPPTTWPITAVADNLGRIILINTRTRRIMRIWKGYRQARCAWLEATNDSTDGNGSKKAFFLVIFAPKRGLLEVWSLQNGPRVSAFMVNGHGRLLSLPNLQNGVLLGGNDPRDIQLLDLNRSGALFLDPDGSFYSVDVPFHLSALSTSATEIYDDSLIKQFNLDNFTKKEELEVDVDGLFEFVQRIRTNSAKERFLDSLIASSVGTSSWTVVENESKAVISIQSLNALVSRLIHHEQCSHGTFGNFHSSASFPYLLALHSLLDLYMILDKYFSECIIDELCKTKVEEAPDNLLDAFCCDRDDPAVAMAVAALKLALSITRRKSPFCSVATIVDSVKPCRLSLQAFLSYFNLRLHQPFDDNSQLELIVPNEHDCSKIPNSHLAKFGATIFAPFLLNPSLEFEPFLKIFKTRVRFLRKDFLVTALIAFWLEPQWNLKPEIFAEQFFRLIKTLTNNFFGDCSKMWIEFLKQTFNSTEQMVILSTNVSAALTIALQFNGLCFELIGELDGRKDNSEKETENREMVSGGGQEHFIVFDSNDLELLNDLRTEIPNFWALLSLHLSVLKLLQILFEENIISPQQHWTCSISRAVHKGIGFYREELGKWVSRIERPNFVVRSIVSAFGGNGSNQTENDFVDASVIGILHLLTKKIFSQSLRLELVLCDSVWECTSTWFRDESRNIQQLKRAVALLELLQSVPKLQNGLALLLWDTFISENFKKLFVLIEEQISAEGPERTDYGGPYPPLTGKDRILRRDVLVAEKDLPEYVTCVRRLLELLAESCCNLSGRKDIAYGSLAGSLHMEDQTLTHLFAHRRMKKHLSLIDKSGEAHVTNTNSDLIRLVDCQKSANYHLALHMVHLAAVMELQINLVSNHYTKPSSLFDANGKRALFNPLSTHPLLPMARVDDRTKMRRQRFAEQYMEALEKGREQSAQKQHPMVDQQSRLDTLHDVLNRLIKDWALDVTALQVKDVIWLYLCGADERAEAKCDELVGNRQGLALQLMPIIAGRIKQLNEQHQGALYNKAIQSSMTSESTWSFIQKTPEEHSPNFEHVNSKQLRRMIKICKACLTEKQSGTKMQSAKIISEGQPVEFTKCQQLLHEFSEFCNVAEWLEING